MENKIKRSQDFYIFASRDNHDSVLDPINLFMVSMADRYDIANVQKIDLVPFAHHGINTALVLKVTAIVTER